MDLYVRSLLSLLLSLLFFFFFEIAQTRNVSRPNKCQIVTLLEPPYLKFSSNT